MANFNHWMKFNIGDYLADTMHLSALQHGAYILLIMHYFKHGTLPKSPAALMRVARVADFRTWARISPEVMALFKLVDGHWRHSRVDAERENAAVKCAAWDVPGETGLGDDGLTRSQNLNKAGRYRKRTGANHTPHPFEVPPNPPQGGGRAGGIFGRRRGKAARNGFVDTAGDMLNEPEQQSDPAADDRVVPLKRLRPGQ